MESRTNNPPLIVILGQTASGKSALAMRLARKFNGEIIAADSRTVYKHIDIGTAKPSKEDRRAVRHHLLDVAEPSDHFTAADFKRLASEAIHDISGRDKIPFLVGGTGLYIDAVLYDFSFRQPPQVEERKKLQQLSVSELQSLLIQRDIKLPINQNNPRHLIRALETGGEDAQKSTLRPNTLVIGLAKDRDELEQSIRNRVDSMLDDGLLDEVAEVSGRYGWDVPALQAPAYKAFRKYLEGSALLDEAKQLFVRYDLQYAKRQKTWFKRNPDIVWISNLEKVDELITSFLNK